MTKALRKWGECLLAQAVGAQLAILLERHANMSSTTQVLGRHNQPQAPRQLRRFSPATFLIVLIVPYNLAPFESSTTRLGHSMDTPNAPEALTEIAARKQRGRPFQPGTSGNPQGRPRGSRNKTTLAVEALLEGEAEGIARKAIERALSGDMAALRLCLERLLPPRHDRPVAFDLPKIETASDALNGSSSILAACAAGALTPCEAAQIMDLISTHLRALEVTEIEARLTALEKAR